jgi:hypothetical protein
MKTTFLLLTMTIIVININAQNVYSTKTGHASFFSKAPMEDIDAHNEKVGAVLNTTLNEVVVVVSIKNFVFKKALMQEHFNDDYLESDKYPDATYNGKINEKVDYTKDGITEVTTTGKLKIHNTERDVTIKGTVTIKNGIITLHTEFNVALKDYNITIPKLVIENIAENILVTIDCPLALYVKK